MTELYWDRFIPIVQFLAELQGPDTEIVLYDVETRKVCYVQNPFDEEMVIGSEMRALEKSFLETERYQKEDFIVNYRALSKREDRLKSATLFLKNRSGELCAIMTVNQKVDRLIDLRNYINNLISGPDEGDRRQRESFYEQFDVSVPDMVTQTIQEELKSLGVPVNRLDSREKMQLIRNLDAKGIFLVKGAVGELARLLETTETTVYRYISRLSSES